MPASWFANWLPSCPAKHFPDGQEVYFTRQTPEPLKLTILVMRQEGGAWSDPQVAPFSGTHDDNCEILSSDGQRLDFTSTLEDRVLHVELLGYQEYAQQARSRLLPGIW